MSGARRAAPPGNNMLVKVGGAALTVALVATFAILLLFGDRLVGDDDPAAENDKDKETAAAAAPVEPGEEDKLVERASAILDTWSQPALGYDEWWKGMRPLLTPGGREAYAFTDPAQVPELAELTADRVVLNPSGATATVWFETSDGVFGVDLSRKAETGPWLAQRVVFPGEESMFA